ncbi:MAG: type II toxin-antitoxin system RelE/ParE family toxin [Sphingomonadales bacterium]|nr:type II toxin-antitoxin system RelE/ParE family toxin [Sphingomonadales bacterium]
MRKVIVRPDAAQDIEDAADYTVGEWGHEQAFRYVGELRQAIESLATTALRHPLYGDILPGLRRKRSGMHHIYYLASKDSVEVLSILHVQRDPGQHLKVERWEDEG